MRAKRNVTGSFQPCMNIRMNRMERKSLMPLKACWYSLTGILNWYHLMGRCSADPLVLDTVSKMSARYPLPMLSDVRSAGAIGISYW